MEKFYIEDDSSFYNNIKKIKDSDLTIHFKYKNKDVIDDRYIDDKMDYELKTKIHMITAANIKDLEKRYSYIYDIVCDELDNKFKDNKICNFKDNKCISVRNNSHCSESLNGCCYGKNRGLCKNFKDGKCTIKSISCKLFTCRYLKKNNIKFSVNDIKLLKYFFNPRQKFILDNSIFKDKEEIIKLLLENK